MSEGSNNFIVELFIGTLEVKHKLTFDKDKEEYFKVLFDTYLNGQGNPAELRDYIAAGMDDPKVIDILAKEVVQWQGKAQEMKAAEELKKKAQEVENQKMNEYVATKTKKPKEEGEPQKKVEEHGKKKHKGESKPKQQNVSDKPEKLQKGEKGEQRHQKAEKGERPEKGDKGQGRGLKFQIAQQGKQKCKFYPFCKNTETCGYFHPSEKPCKYKEKCLKANCAFAHPFKKTNPIEEMMKRIMDQQIPLNKNKNKKYKPKDQSHPEHQEPKKE